jgi:hypothetical protein
MKIAESPAAWRVADLEADRSWVFTLDKSAADALARAVKSAHEPGKPLFNYRREDVDLGPAAEAIDAAVHEAHHGRGLALLRGLPRDGLGEAEFELLNWAIGLHIGVARPQSKASQYLAAVRDAGVDYRSATGRGYSSNAGLDFHADGADLATLGCYNRARSGGQSMVSSSVTAHDILAEERPDLAEVAYQDFYFSRQGEQTAGEAPFYVQPLFDEADGRLFGKWNRNRVQSAQRLDGVPPLSAAQRELGDVLDDILSRPDVMFSFYLEPGDLQILNNHVMLHSRTEYVDFDAPSEKRLLWRLWLAPPDSVRLPDSWGDLFRSTQPGTVRGGIRGHCYDDACRAFETRQAAALGMAAGG